MPELLSLVCPLTLRMLSVPREMTTWDTHTEFDPARWQRGYEMPLLPVIHPNAMVLPNASWACTHGLQPTLLSTFTALMCIRQATDQFKEMTDMV